MASPDPAQADTLEAQCRSHLAALQGAISALHVGTTPRAGAAAATGGSSETAEVRELRLERDKLRQEAASKNAQLKTLLDTMRRMQDDIDQFAGSVPTAS